MVRKGVGVWDGFKGISFKGSIPSCFQLFGMHLRIYGVYPKLIPKRWKKVPFQLINYHGKASFDSFHNTQVAYQCRC